MAIPECLRPRALALQDPLLHRHLSLVALTLQLAGMPDDDQTLLQYASPQSLGPLVSSRLDGCARITISRYLAALTDQQRTSLDLLAARIAIAAGAPQVARSGGRS